MPLKKINHPGLRGIGLTLLAASLVTFGACHRPAEQSSADKSTPVGSAPPPTAFPMPPLKPLGSMGWELAGGRRNHFSDFKGRVLVLDFYATWCEPCRDSIPHLVELQSRYGNQGLQVVGLNVGGPDDLQEVPEFAKEFKIQYPLGIPDDDLSSFLLSDEGAIPQTFVFDRKGQLAKRFVGYSDIIGSEIDKTISAALKESPE